MSWAGTKMVLSVKNQIGGNLYYHISVSTNELLNPDKLSVVERYCQWQTSRSKLALLLLRFPWGSSHNRS